MIKALFSLNPSQIKAVVRTTVVLAGTLLSPSWYLLHLVIDPYININALLTQGITLSSFFQVLIQFKAIQTATIVFHIIPSLFGCLMISVGFLFFCGWLAEKTAQYFVYHSANAADPEYPLAPR